MTFKFTGIFKKKYSRDGVALEGEITTVTVNGPAEVLVVSLGASKQEIDALARKINATDELLKALENMCHMARTYFPDAQRSHPEGAFQRARAAIAKARGEA